MKKSTKKRQFDAVVLGCSAGGISALKQVLPQGPQKLPFALLIVQHIAANAGDLLAKTFANQHPNLPIKEAEDKEAIIAGTVYFAPPNYHLLVERDHKLALSIDAPVCYCRPSIDVLFETAARCFGERLVGVVMTGANNDGSFGLAQIQAHGGLTVVQNPKTADTPYMPAAALARIIPDHVLSLTQIASLIIQLANEQESN